MPFTITQFRSEISKQKNLARPNLFEVNVTGKAINNALFPFMAKIATIPPSTMGVVEVPYFGRQVKVPGNRTFDNLSITILNDDVAIITGPSGSAGDSTSTISIDENTTSVCTKN